MPAPIKGGLPPDCTLSAGYILRLVALNPTTGANVGSVQLSNVCFFVTDLAPAASGSLDDTPMPLLVPSNELV